MSQYNKMILTNAGLELAKRANAGQAKFEITRAVTSADDWSSKTIQDLEEVTAIPNIMQQGTVMDTEEVESNNSVIGVSLCFANKDLSTGYQIRIIGLYVKEEGQENDFLYAVTTAVTPEYMPDFNDKVLYRFNMQMYLVIGKAQAVNVVINDGASVTHGQFDKYKGEVTASLEKIENTHKEDMSHVVKSASINGGDEILPDEAGKLELVVPAPDLSKYVSLEQLTETLKSKADITAIPDKTATEEGIKQAKELAQEADTKAQNALDNKADKTTVEENLATKANQSDLDKTNAEVAEKANSSDVYTKTDIDNKLTTVGAVKTVDKIQPDSSGNVDLRPEFNSLLGRNNLLTDDEMDISKATKTDPAQQAISNAKYANGVNTFHFCGVTNYEMFNWKIAVQPNTNYELNIIANSTNQLTGLSSAQTYIPITVDSSGAFANDTTVSNGDLGKGQLKLPWQGIETEKITFNSQNYSNIYLAYNFGVVRDGVNTDITLQTTLLKADPIQSQIDNLQSQVDSKTSGTIVTAYDIASKTPTTETNSYTSEELVDQNVLSQFADAINSINSTRVPLVNGSGDDDLLAFKTNQIRLYPGNGKTCKNLPPASNTQWFTVQYVFETPNGDGIAIFRSPANEVWTIGNNGGFYTTGWVKLANSNDISDLQNQIQQLKDNQFEVQTFTDATAAASWEAQKPGKRMAIVNS